MSFYAKTNGEWEKLTTLETYKTFSLVYGDGNAEVRSVAPDGSTTNWVFGGHSDTINDLAIDESQFVYSCSLDGSVRKNDEGTEMWAYENAGTSYNAITLAGGYVYVGNSSGRVIRIDTESGNRDQSYEFTGHTGTINGIEANYDGTVHTVSGDRTVRKADSNGNEVWNFTGHGRTINGVVIGDDGSVYTAAFGGTVKKIYSNGKEAWSFESFVNTVNDVAINDNTGSVYGSDGGGVIRKISNDTGTQQLEADLSTSSINSISVTKTGDIYFGDSSQTVRKITDTGLTLVEDWELNAPTGSVQATAVKITT